MSRIGNSLASRWVALGVALLPASDGRPESSQQRSQAGMAKGAPAGAVTVALKLEPKAIALFQAS
jgi:hypothetical protein